jgi:hypothetical protein
LGFCSTMETARSGMKPRTVCPNRLRLWSLTTSTTMGKRTYSR